MNRQLLWTDDALLRAITGGDAERDGEERREEGCGEREGRDGGQRRHRDGVEEGEHGRRVESHPRHVAVGPQQTHLGNKGLGPRRCVLPGRQRLRAILSRAYAKFMLSTADPPIQKAGNCL